MHLVRSLAVVASISFTLCQAQVSLAQSVEPSSTGKGIVGGTLLGAEIVLLTEAAIDVSPEWLYYVGGAAGAVGGGVAGYFLEDKLTSQSNMLLLAAGMLLVIPTTVAVLSATAYEQPVEYTQDTPSKDEPPADPALPIQPINPATTDDTSGPASTSPALPSPAPAPQSRNQKSRHRHSLPLPALVGIDAQQRIHLGIPAVEVRDTFTRVEVAQFAVKQRTELRIPLLRVAF
jgi:hypothetical protein